jgi:lipoyl(octanoyl) transferase
MGIPGGQAAGSRLGIRRLDVVRLLGRTPYFPMWERQRALAAARERNEIGDLLLLLEHPHVYTNGRGGQRQHLLVDEATLSRLGASYVEVDRGGDITYHGPGQLVGYPIVALDGLGVAVRGYVRGLEQALIRTAAQFGVTAHSVPGYTGVWVGEEKLAAIGVRVTRGVCYHGFALNITPDLTYFRYIVPCGIANRGVTSLARLLGHSVDVDEVVPVYVAAFAREFGLEFHWGDRSASPPHTDVGCG